MSAERGEQRGSPGESDGKVVVYGPARREEAEHGGEQGEDQAHARYTPTHLAGDEEIYGHEAAICRGEGERDAAAFEALAAEAVKSRGHG